jgi:putative hydrolase of HD superfamily
MFCPPVLASRLCIPRCIELCLVHDMAECLVGDITPLHTHITKQEKARREAATMEYISQSLLGGAPGCKKACERLMGLFQEYEDNQTLEARFVHDVDKLEMMLQTIECEQSLGRDLSEFYHVHDDICLPEVMEWANVVMKERNLAPAYPGNKDTV